MILDIRHLCLRRTDGVELVSDICFCLSPGERLGLVGESGSGKSLLARAIFGVPPARVAISRGSVRAFAVDMNRPSHERELARGRRIAFVPQDPSQALSPFLTVRQHLSLLPSAHLNETCESALARLTPLMEGLRLPSGRDFMARRPHELSGGQRQRLALVMALSCDPELLVLDEPTSALDLSARMEVVSMLSSIRRERSLAWLWITHDLELASLATDRLVVMYGGHVVEAGPTNRLLSEPRHPYTARLLEAALDMPSDDSGVLPAPEERPDGCPFGPRCPRRNSSCSKWAPWTFTDNGGYRCESPLEPRLRADIALESMFCAGSHACTRTDPTAAALLG